MTVTTLLLIEGSPNRSLLSAGYSMVGIDEGWENCGADGGGRPSCCMIIGGP